MGSWPGSSGRKKSPGSCGCWCIGLLGFAGLLCVMLAAGALVLAFSWDTPYRIAAAIALLAAYGLVAGFAWIRLKALSAQGSQAFTATREELAADIALLKSNL